MADANAEDGVDSRHELPRVLNVSHATSIVVGIIIGSGIFLVPREMMAAVGSSGMVYAVWMVGGLLSLFGAMTYAEIAAGRPLYGGDYAFLREAYGDLTGFLYMWTWIAIAKPASLATIVAGLARVLGTFRMFSFFAQPAMGGILWSQVFAIGVTWLITGLNIVSTRESANVQLVLTWLKGVLMVVIAGFCFGVGILHAYAGAGWHNFATGFAGARGGFSGFMVALIASGSGCFPYHYTTLPGISGKVVNEETLNPLADAQVFFSLTNPAFVAHSVDDGTFFAKPKKQWGIWIIAQDVFPRACSIYIRRPGYQTDCVNFLFNPAGGKNAQKDLGIITLKPVMQP